MVLANTRIAQFLREERVGITGYTGQEEPSLPPFNTSSIDLRLSGHISRPKNAAIAVDLRQGSVKELISQNFEKFRISREQPFLLKQNDFILGQTIEKVNFPIIPGKTSLSARVEGRSSLARCGLLVHFTAPTIHAGFNGTIALEIINLGPFPFLLHPEMPVCQLIIEEVSGVVDLTPSQFRGQDSSAGN